MDTSSPSNHDSDIDYDSGSDPDSDSDSESPIIILDIEERAGMQLAGSVRHVYKADKSVTATS